MPHLYGHPGAVQDDLHDVRIAVAAPILHQIGAVGTGLNLDYPERGLRLREAMLNDPRRALRTFVKKPGFTFIVVLTLGSGRAAGLRCSGSARDEVYPMVALRFECYLEQLLDSQTP